MFESMKFCFISKMRKQLIYFSWQVTKEEWMNYYSGVSASIDADHYFDVMMHNSFKM